MTDMQRYTVDPDDLLEHVPVSMYPSLREVVLASDAEAAIRDAYERGYDEATVASIKYGEIRYAGGQRDMLARCIAAVEALTPDATGVVLQRRHVLAAIKGQQA